MTYRDILFDYARTFQAYGATLKASARIVRDARRGRLTHEAADNHVHKWATRIFNIAEASLQVHGTDEIQPKQSYVLMSNHASFLDIPAVIRAYPNSTRMVAKSEMAAVPVFGEALRNIGTIIVDRADTKKSIEQLNRGKEILTNGVSVWISPEGTRSRDGQLGPFRKGGFHMAIQLEVPILPIWIDGAFEVYSRSASRAKRGGQIHVAFGSPVRTTDCTKEDIPTLMQSVRDTMLSLQKNVATMKG